MKRSHLLLLVLLFSPLTHAETTGFSSGLYGGVTLGDQKLQSTWQAQSYESGGLAVPLDSSSTTIIDSNYSVANGIVGFNYVTGQYLFGIESQAKFGKNTTTMAGVPGCAINCQSTPGPATDTATLSLGNSISLLARLGWLPQQDLLVYLLGGVTRQNVSSSVTCQFSTTDPLCLVAAGNPYSTASASDHVYGSVIGIGTEKKIDNLSFRLEFKYTNLNAFNTVAEFHDALNGTYTYGNKVNLYDLSLGVLYHF